MLDYRKLEDEPLNALLVRQPGIGLKDRYYDESDPDIAIHLEKEYRQWVKEQGERVAGELYLSKNLGYIDEAGELRNRLEFLDVFSEEMNREGKEGEERGREIHLQYREKYLFGKHYGPRRPDAPDRHKTALK